MIFMRMREHDADDIIAFAFQVMRIRQNKIDTRNGVLPAEGYANIDDQPAAIIGRTITIGIEVHANLARSAKRQKDEFVRGLRLIQIEPPFRLKISSKPREVKS